MRGGKQKLADGAKGAVTLARPAVIEWREAVFEAKLGDAVVDLVQNDQARLARNGGPVDAANESEQDGCRPHIQGL